MGTGSAHLATGTFAHFWQRGLLKTTRGGLNIISGLQEGDMDKEPSLEELEHVYALVVNVLITAGLGALIVLVLMLL